MLFRFVSSVVFGFLISQSLVDLILKVMQQIMTLAGWRSGNALASHHCEPGKHKPLSFVIQANSILR